jgi:DNA-binding SARP family transcriptional activator/Flp pilus assembly protein TadD
MLRLQLLGQAKIDGSDVPLSRAPRGARLALLALLVSDGRVGASRDRLMSLLWPELATDRARHLLRDTLYRLREAIGPDTISATGDLLILDPASVECDVWQFESAIATQNWAEADRLYGGALLEGSFPVDSSEFEQWLDAERARLSRLHAQCLEAVAQELASRSEYVEAATAWRRLSAIDPYNARYAIGLMQALDATGDRAGALRHATAHTAALANDLGAAPDPGVVALAERLRVNPGFPPAARPTAPSDFIGAPHSKASALLASQVPWRRWTFAASMFVTFGATLLWIARSSSRMTNSESAGTPPIVLSGTGDAIAHDQYLRGRHYLARRGTANLLSALSEFEGAVRRDPQFARAHAGISAASTLLTLYNGRAYSRDSMLPIALAAAYRAVAIDDSLSEAQAALGQVLTYLGRRPEAERAYRRAIAREPNDGTIRQWYAELLLTLGQVDDAIVQMEAAIRLDPQSAINHAVASNHYRLAGRYAEALRVGERALALDPTMRAVWEFYSRTLFDAGRRDSAERIFARHSPRHMMHAYIRAKNGDLTVRDSLRRIVEDWSDGALPVDGTVAMAVISLAAGNEAAAVRVLTRAQERDPAFPLHNTLIDPIYDSLRHMPEFREIVRKAGLDETLHLRPRRSRSAVVAAP